MITTPLKLSDKGIVNDVMRPLNFKVSGLHKYLIQYLREWDELVSLVSDAYLMYFHYCAGALIILTPVSSYYRVQSEFYIIFLYISLEYNTFFE